MSEHYNQGNTDSFEGRYNFERGAFNGINAISADRVLDLIEALEAILTEMKYGVMPYQTDRQGFPESDEGAAATYLVKSVFDVIGNATATGIVEYNLFDLMTSKFNDEADREEYLPVMKHYRKYKTEYDQELRKLIKAEME